MPLFSMAPKTSTIKTITPSEEDPSKAAVEPKRPGTSGTELLLTTNRRTASAQYLAAQRAENAYKAKKRSAGARQLKAEAGSHFKQSGAHFKEGMKSSYKMVAAVPWMFRDWKENKQAQNEKKAIEKYMKKKSKLEERIAQQEAGQEKEKEEAEL